MNENVFGAYDKFQKTALSELEKFTFKAVEKITGKPVEAPPPVYEKKAPEPKPDAKPVAKEEKKETTVKPSSPAPEQVSVSTDSTGDPLLDEACKFAK